MLWKVRFSDPKKKNEILKYMISFPHNLYHIEVF